jgi:hypothetical protein
MKAIARKTRTARQTGQSLTEVMLILAAVAAALAVVFPTVEYLTYYRGPVKPHKFDPAETASPVRTAASAPVAAPAAAPKAEPAKTPEAPATPPAKTPEAPKTAPTPAP